LKINRNLPKYKKLQDTKSSTISIVDGDSTDIFWGRTGSNGFTQSSMDSEDMISEFQRTSIDYLKYLKQKMSEYNISVLNKWKYNVLFFFATFFLKNKKKTVVTKKMYSIEDFFKTIKDSKMEINKTKDVLEKYENILKEARKNGQQALIEKLLKMKDVVASECRLIENGITKYVTEEQVVKLYKNVDQSKHLKLTYIDNYLRIIPSEVIKLKETADELCVFDNYVILHYDPFNDSTDTTEKEKEEEKKRKDPILFGVVLNSRKLYFIGDWTDDYCDLTLEKMMEIISEKELEINNDSVKSYIDKI
jgi:hypothetical protein